MYCFCLIIIGQISSYVPMLIAMEAGKSRAAHSHLMNAKQYVRRLKCNEKIKNSWLLLAFQYRMLSFTDIFEVKLHRKNCTDTIQRFLTNVYTYLTNIPIKTVHFFLPKEFTCSWPTIVNHFLNLYHQRLVSFEFI